MIFSFPVFRPDTKRKGRHMDKKKIFLIVESVLCFIIAAFFATSALIIYNKGLAVKAADPTAWIYTREIAGKYLLICLPVIVVTLVMAFVGIFAGIRDDSQDKPVKNIDMKKAKELDDNGRKKQATVLTIVRVAVLVVAVTLIVVGIFNGSMRDVLIKAATICTECVGLG